MTKKIMNAVIYEYKNGSNILKLVKHITAEKEEENRRRKIQ